MLVISTVIVLLLLHTQQSETFIFPTFNGSTVERRWEMMEEKKD